MAIPADRDAANFYRCAFQRYDESRILFEQSYPTGAVYLAGYAVECMLKALLLMTIPSGRRADVFRSFRGHRGHDYDWLRSQYLLLGGPRLPAEIVKHFTIVNGWTTELRYSPRAVKGHDAEAFLKSAAAILRWADGRL